MENEFTKFMDEITAKTGIRLTNSDAEALQSGVSPFFVFLSTAAFCNPKQVVASHPMKLLPETIFMFKSSMETMAKFKSILLHELAHATGTVERCNRIALTKLDSLTTIERACEEIIADSVATSMTQLFGWNTPETDASSQQYIDDQIMILMAEGAYSRVLMKDLAAEVRKSIDYMMTNWLTNVDQQHEAV